ncbi:hypothetical protein [Lactobacillus sp. UMNPBX6]|nr:hypothetical protein [Lactobacillus sp. UMNPBX6]
MKMKTKGGMLVNAQFIAIGIIFVGLYFLTKEKKLAVKRIRRHR